jgi:hypothetical protein
MRTSQQVVSDELVRFDKQLVEVQDLTVITLPNILEESREDTSN